MRFTNTKHRNSIMSFTPSAHTGIVHRFSKRLVAFEHGIVSTSSLSQNTLLWIGGLGDGLLTVSYPTAIAAALPPQWSLAQVLLSSSYTGWGTSELKRDAKELARAVAYFRSIRRDGKVVLMGHSTGCQDSVEYLAGPGATDRLKDKDARVDGWILQAPVSDREALVHTLGEDKYWSAVKLAKEWTADGRGADILPNSATNLIFGTSMTARRFLSLASPNKDGDDDYFSSDLPDEKLCNTFGKASKEAPLCILFSGSDEHVPAVLDKKGLVGHWTQIVRSEGGTIDEMNGGVVEGATHNLEGDDDDVVNTLVSKVVGFIGRLDKGDFTKRAHL